MSGAKQAGKTVVFRALRFGFRLVPMSEAMRDRLRQRFLDRFSHLVPPGPRGQAAAAVEHRPRVRSDERAIGYVPYRQEPLPSPLPATLVAFYLPQFHPIAENDEWWGKGFTEWRNVARALPQFEGHAQPRLPADLGFYDLRNVDTMREQVKLASEYGIGAFCFYFYWFSGRTLLEQPLRQWLDDPTLELPFCLCWANENWSRRWDGRSDDILIAQQHSPEDDLAFITHIAAYLRDPRYLRVEGKPLLLVYRPDLLPDARQTAARWRQWCRDNTIGEIHIAYVQGFERPDPRDLGFDAAVEFPPNLSNPRDLTTEQRLINPDFGGRVLDWRELAADYSSRVMPAYPLYPGVNTGWDNEPRRAGKGRVYAHASPRRYRDWLQSTITDRLADKAPCDRLVFINAWNEWAEGAVLEPDATLGHGWLAATRQALRCVMLTDHRGFEKKPRPCVVVHVWYLETLDEILAVLESTGLDWRLIVTTTEEKAHAVQKHLCNRGMEGEIKIVNNQGRDVLPFLHVAGELLDAGVDVALKLHTKRSIHLPDGDEWRHEMLESLVSSRRASGIISAFEDDRTLGIVGPESHLQQVDAFQGCNSETVARLGVRIGLRPLSQKQVFVAGTMFWVRLEALRPLLDANLLPEEFEKEFGQLDGTLAHAIERLFVAVANDAGFSAKDALTLSGSTPLRSTQRERRFY